MNVFRRTVNRSPHKRNFVYKAYDCLRTRYYDCFECYPCKTETPIADKDWYFPSNGAEITDVPVHLAAISYVNSRKKRKTKSKSPMQRCDHVTVTSDYQGGILELDKTLDVFSWGDETPYNCTDRYVAQHDYRVDVIRIGIEDVLKHASLFGIPDVPDVDTRNEVDEEGEPIKPTFAHQVDFDPYLVNADEEEPYSQLVEKMVILDRIGYDTIIPEMEGGFKAPVFIGELIELKMLWRSIGTFLISLPSTLVKFFRHPLKVLSDGWLSATFGWIPFVSEVKQIFSIMESIDDEVVDFIEGQDKRHQSHFKKGLNPLTFKPEEWFSSEKYLTIDTTDSEWSFASDAFHKIVIRCKVTREIEDCDYHLTLDYSYRLPGWNRAIQTFLASMDRWGMNVSASDLWELVPFSFVVDWFYDVQSCVETLDYTNLPVKATVYDSCRSIKYRLIERVELVEIEELYLTPASLNTADDWRISPVDASHENIVEAYYRFPGIVIPGAQQLPGLRFPSGMQWVSAGALLVTRRG